MKNWVPLGGAPGLYVQRPLAEQTRMPSTPEQRFRREQALALFDAKVRAAKEKMSSPKLLPGAA